MTRREAERIRRSQFGDVQRDAARSGLRPDRHLPTKRPVRGPLRRRAGGGTGGGDRALGPLARAPRRADRPGQRYRQQLRSKGHSSPETKTPTSPQPPLPTPVPTPTPDVPPPPPRPKSIPPASGNSCPPNAPIKGNQSGIYHVPGGGFYDRTNPEECFANEAEAQAAGYRASKR